jgi:hypothetical protein
VPAPAASGRAAGGAARRRDRRHRSCLQSSGAAPRCDAHRGDRCTTDVSPPLGRSRCGARSAR